MLDFFTWLHRVKRESFYNFQKVNRLDMFGVNLRYSTAECKVTNGDHKKRDEIKSTQSSSDCGPLNLCSTIASCLFSLFNSWSATSRKLCWLFLNSPSVKQDCALSDVCVVVQDLIYNESATLQTHTING